MTGIGPNGEPLSGWERGATVVAAGLPFVPGSVVRKALGVASPLVDDALDLVTRADDAADAAKDVGTLAGRSTWPNTADEMTEYLGIPGQQVPDGPITPGRAKTVWRPNSDTTITLERHPYHPDAPEWQRDYRWHLDTPDHDHQRFLPGDPIPGLEDQGVTER